MQKHHTKTTLLIFIIIIHTRILNFSDKSSNTNQHEAIKYGTYLAFEVPHPPQYTHTTYIISMPHKIHTLYTELFNTHHPAYRPLPLQTLQKIGQNLILTSYYLPTLIFN
jgi:hypothetical protein